jgi:quinoprotein glucose dehydrogenase
VKPPYGRITAIDLRIGEHAWQIPFGEGPRRHPAISHLDLGPLGQNRVANEGGLLVTKTLLIGYFHKMDDRGKELIGGTVLQAYDKATGELLAELELDATLHSAPMTYLHQGRQYIVIAGGDAKGRESPVEQAQLLALALP